MAVYLDASEPAFDRSICAGTCFNGWMQIRSAFRARPSLSTTSNVNFKDTLFIQFNIQLKQFDMHHYFPPLLLPGC